MSKDPFPGAVTLKELAENIIRETQQAVDNPTPEVKALIDKHGKNAVTGMVLREMLGGAGASHFNITYDGGKELPQ